MATHHSDRLPSEDAIFLYLERKEMPLHIGSVSVLDGEIPFDTYVDFVESKLPLIPRYRQRVVFPPFNLGHPTWEDDPDFDIHNHMRHVRLKRGVQRELEALAGQIFSEMMDRDKPLWDLTLVDGLSGGRSAFISRVHHCLVDGVSGVGIINVMLDPNAKPQSPAHPRPFHPSPLPAPVTSLADALLSSYSEMFGRVLSAEAAALDVAQAMVSDQARQGFNQLVRLAPELLTPIERLPFNRPCLGPRKVAWTEISIPQVSAIREAAGGTLNDVVLAVVTIAVRRYTEIHHGSVRHRLLRMMVPVNLRRDGNHNGLGNIVSVLPVSIPLDIRDPVKLLDAIRIRTQALKTTHLAELIHLASTWMGTAPAPLQALLGPLAGALPVPPFNLVCTNVPGPPVPLKLLGREMVTFYPYVPIGNDMGVGCAIQSYNGKLYFGFTGDAAAAPDVDRLRDFLDRAFSELSEAAGVKQSKPTPRPSKTVARHKRTVTEATVGAGV